MSWRRPVAALVGLALAALAVLWLEDATKSVHDPPPADTEIELVVDASIRHSEPGQTLAERVEAKILSCRLEVRSDVVGDIRSDGGGRFSATLTPSMDASNRKQFRGCLEDWTIEHVKINVVRLEDLR